MLSIRVKEFSECAVFFLGLILLTNKEKKKWYAKMTFFGGYVWNPALRTDVRDSKKSK